MTADASTSSVQQVLVGIVERSSEAMALVHDLGDPHVDESFSDLHTRLLVTRSAMTRLAALLGELIQIRFRVEQVLIDRRGELEEAEAVVVGQQRHVVEDFSSAKEKNARLAAGTLESRRRVRVIEKLLKDVDAAVEYIRTRHRELDRAVRDIDTRLRIISFEPNIS